MGFSQKKYKERDSEIYAIRQSSNRTLKNIGDEYGLSRERVRQICLKQSRLGIPTREDEIGLGELSVRAANAIRNARLGHDDKRKFTPQEVAANLRMLPRGPNCGSFTMKEIGQWLKDKNCYEDWMKSWTN